MTFRPRSPADPPSLLVEDKDSLRTMLRLAVEAQGHTVIDACDQAEAVAALQTTHPPLSCRISVFLMATASVCCARPRSSIPSCP